MECVIISPHNYTTYYYPILSDAMVNRANECINLVGFGGFCSGPDTTTFTQLK